MPRRKDTRPTNIYWLYDTRPETVVMFGPEGKPFYCGKTVVSEKERLRGHRNYARKFPTLPHSIRIETCGENIVMRVIDVVPSPEDWCARETFWIATIRYLFPGGTNTASGGRGMPGLIHTAETRAKISAAGKGRKWSREAIEKRSASVRGRIPSPEHRAKISAALIGVKHSEEHREKNAAAKRGTKQSPELIERRIAKIRGRKRSPEAIAKTVAGLTGRKRSPQECANISAGKRGKKRKTPFSPETCAKISAHKTAWWAARRAAAEISHA